MKRVIKARFIGEDGSRGFVKGETYEIKSKISGTVYERYLLVETLDHERSCAYSGIGAFLENWETISVERID